MDLFMVLNLASISNPAATKSIARQWMTQLLRTLSASLRSGIKTLRTESRVYEILLAENYPVSRWLNDNRVSQEERDLLLTIETQTPILSGVDKTKASVEIDLADFTYEGKEATELGLAYLFDGLAISLASEEKWNSSKLELLFQYINENEELSEDNVEVIHASSEQHIHEHTDWIKQRIRTQVKDGAELWQLKEELFPNLIFCDQVEKQLQNIMRGDPMLEQVRKKLFELEDYCKSWTIGAFDPDSLRSKATPESETRLKKLKKQLTITCPDGEKRLFSLHIRMTPGAWRLHFYDLEPGSIIIGYIGFKIN